MNRLKLTVMAAGAIAVFCALSASSAFAAGPPENTVLPAIQVSTPKLWITYTTTRGTWTNEPTSYAYQWQRCNSTGGECSDIAGGTAKTYKVVPPDEGHTLRVKVTASNSEGQGSATSTQTGMVAKGPEFISSTHSYPVLFEFSGPAAFETTNKTLSCETLRGWGKITSPTELRESHVTLTGCRGGTWVCTTLESAPLHGYIAYINAATKSVGVELGGDTTAFSENWKCNGITTHVTGQVIGEITSVNTESTAFTLKYRQSKGVQNPNHFEGGPTQQLEWDYGFKELWAIQAEKNAFNTNVKGQFLAP